MRTQFKVSINNDNEPEKTENFTLTIDQLLLPFRTEVGTPSQATVEIVEDDGE